MPKGGYGGGTAKPSTPISNKKVTSKNTVFRNPEASTVDYYKDKRNEYAKGIAAQVPSYQDPFNGANLLDILLHGQHATGGGGGGRGGGGGGGSNAAAIAARNAAIEDALAQENAALDAQLGSQNQAFDARNTQLQGIQNQAASRLSGITGELNQAAGQARGATAQSFSQGDQALQALLAQYTQMAHSRDATQNATLGAFGAGQVAPSEAPVQDMISAGRVANTMRGNAADQMYAGRSQVYAGLVADAQMQNGQMYDSLLARLSQERNAAAQQAAQQSAQYAIQAAQARI